MDELALRPMSPQEFRDFLASQEAGYVEDMVRAGAWNRADAAEQYRRQIAQILPQGRDTPGTHFLVAHDGDVLVGRLWIGAASSGTPGDVWIYDIEVLEVLRGRGYGRRLLTAGEAFAREAGAQRIGLNVFASNVTARRLYETSGYEVTSQQMRKSLA